MDFYDRLYDKYDICLTREDLEYYLIYYLKNNITEKFDKLYSFAIWLFSFEYVMDGCDHFEKQIILIQRKFKKRYYTKMMKINTNLNNDIINEIIKFI